MVDNINPPDEPQRLAAARRYDILDTPPDGAFDRITAIAARLFGVPISIISVVDHDRIWFKSRHGIDVPQVGRDPGLCASAILQDDPWVLTDAKRDVRALANPLVAGEFGLRFYAGVPLRTSDGFNLGTLNVIDKEPREVTPQELASLQDLASVVVDQLELRLSARQALGDKEVLLRELQHRTKNNLQVITSLLSFKAKGTRDAGARRDIEDVRRRVETLALVHEQLLRSRSVDRIELAAYLRELCTKLVDVAGRDPERIALSLKLEEVTVSPDKAVPLGLIVNEIVSNSLEHAFPEGRGTLQVRLSPADDGTATLVIADDGPGIPADARTGLGHGLIRGLAVQIDAEIAVETERGTRYTITFPA